MLTTPWKTRGICVSAPASNEIELFKEFVEKKLAPGKCNLMVMIIRYRYQWKSHPECMGKDPLSEEQVKEMVKVCRDNGIRLIPDMNLLGHQFYVFRSDDTDKVSVVYKRDNGGYGQIECE